MRTPPTLTALVLSLSLGSHTAAQEPGTTGDIAPVPMGYLFKTVLGENGSTLIYSKMFGANEVLVQTIPVGGNPDFNVGKILGDGGFLNGEIDAIASGNDLMPVQYANGKFTLIAGVNGNPWAAILASVENDADGIPGSLLHSRINSTASRSGSEVMAYYSENTALPNIISDSTYVDASSDFWVGQSPLNFTGTPDIDSLDVYIPNIMLNVETQIPDMPIRDTVYFSLTKESAGESGVTLPNIGLSVDEPVNGTSIIRATWDRPSSNWINFKILRSASQINELENTEEIDAIAIGNATGTNASQFSSPIILFSHEKKNDDDDSPQIRVHARHNNTERTGELHRHGGGTVQNRLGVELGDEVDSLCVYDPDPTFKAKLIGKPVKGNINWVHNETMTLGVCIDRNLNKVHFTISGWGGPPHASNVLLHFGVENAFVIGTLPPLPMGVRQAYQKWYSFSYNLPPGLPTDSTFHFGVELKHIASGAKLGIFAPLRDHLELSHEIPARDMFASRPLSFVRET